MYMQMIFFKELLSKEKSGIANIIFTQQNKILSIFNTSDKTYNAINPKYIFKKETKEKHRQDGHKQGVAVLQVSQSFPHKPFA